MKKHLLWGSLFILLSLIGGIGTSAISSRMSLFEDDSDFLNVPIEFKDAYLGPADKRWAKYVDNPLPSVIHFGDKSSKRIALTFDDGPRPESTIELLEILRTFNAKATFFVVGMQAEKYPDLIKRLYDEGHELGNHTYSHYRITTIPRDKIVEEIEKTRTIVFNQTGFIPYLFRPPGGKFNPETLGIIKELKYTTVLWTNNSGDWKPIPAKKLTNRVVDNTVQGSIILMHNSPFSSTLKSLPSILQKLQAQGYDFVTISDLYS